MVKWNIVELFMEKQTVEGDSPVYEMIHQPSRFRSTVGHVESRGKMGGPSSKAKYYLMTDSELVPWGKGEKYSERRVK